MKKGTTNPDGQDPNSLSGTGQQAAIIVLAAGICLVLFLRYFTQAPQQTGSGPLPVIIDIQGAVKNPGVYLFHTPSVTVAAAIKAAGGLQATTTNHIPEQWAGHELPTGQRLHVVAGPQGAVAIHLESMAAGARLALGEKLDLNRATERELRLVPQMRPEFATAIVRRRQRNPWTSLRELQTIPGIGPKTIGKWADYLKITQ